MTQRTWVIALLAMVGCKSEDLREKSAKEEQAKLVTLKAEIGHLAEAQADAAKRPPIAATDLKVPQPGSIAYFPAGDAARDGLLSVASCTAQADVAARDVDYSPSKTRDCLADYLGFVRIEQEVPPTIDGSDFTPGTMSGDVLVYEFATGKYLGGVRFAVTNSEKVDVTYADNPAAQLSSLTFDLMVNAKAEVEKLTR